MWSKHSRRALPKKRSHRAFARGARYGILNTSMPLLSATRSKALPNLLSLSRRMNRGYTPLGVASRSYCATHCCVGWRVTPKCTTQRDESSMTEKAKSVRNVRSMTGKKSQAQMYPALPNQSQTYSVGADNADLRHQLARLRSKTRCYSKCLQALGRDLTRMVNVWNRCQLFRRLRRRYPTNLFDFISVRDEQTPRRPARQWPELAR